MKLLARTFNGEVFCIPDVRLTGRWKQGGLDLQVEISLPVKCLLCDFLGTPSTRPLQWATYRDLRTDDGSRVNEEQLRGGVARAVKELHASIGNTLPENWP